MFIGSSGPQRIPWPKLEHSWRDMKIRIVAVNAITAFSLICGSGATPVMMSGRKPERAIIAAIDRVIRGDGYDGPLTFLRNDLVTVPLDPTRSHPYVFYEITKEGWVIDERKGRIYQLPPIGANAWRVFVNRESLEVYRLFGFKANDFPQLSESLYERVGAGEAEELAKEYVRLTHSDGTSVLDDLYSAARFMEDTVYEARGEETLEGQFLPWFEKTKGRVAEALNAKRIVEGEDAFRVTVFAGVSTDLDVVGARVEIRKFTVEVRRKGTTQTLREDELVHFPLDALAPGTSQLNEKGSKSGAQH